MSELRELYQEVILDHSKSPRNFGTLEQDCCQAQGYNPLCGDRLTLYLDIKDERIKQARFEGSGCAISTASASMMTEVVKGKTREEIETLFDEFHGMVMGERDPETETPHLGKLRIFAGVKAYPMRVKCATLAWHTLKAAWDQQPEAVSTE